VVKSSQQTAVFQDVWSFFLGLDALSMYHIYPTYASEHFSIPSRAMNTVLAAASAISTYARQLTLHLSTFANCLSTQSQDDHFPSNRCNHRPPSPTLLISHFSSENHGRFLADYATDRRQTARMLGGPSRISITSTHVGISRHRLVAADCDAMHCMKRRILRHSAALSPYRSLHVRRDVAQTDTDNEREASIAMGAAQNSRWANTTR
jgi:hypothetical protein